MSIEIRTSPQTLSIDPDIVPAGRMLVGFLLPLADVGRLTLGTPVTITVPEGAKP